MRWKLIDVATYFLLNDQERHLQQVVAADKPITPVADIPCRAISSAILPRTGSPLRWAPVSCRSLSPSSGASMAVRRGSGALAVQYSAVRHLHDALRRALDALFPEASRVFSHSVCRCSSAAFRWDWPQSSTAFDLRHPAHIGDIAVAIATALWWIDVAMSLACGLAIPVHDCSPDSRILSTR